MKNYTKREFIRLAGIGTLGSLLFGCYKKEVNTPLVLTENNTKDANKKREVAFTDPRVASNTQPIIDSKDVVFLVREDAAYEELKKTYNKRINKSPKIIAQCKTEEGVIQAIHKAKEEGLKVAIRSGGHSFEGFSNINDGLLLDVRQINQIKDLGNHEYEIGSGALLIEIYDKLLPKNRILPAGSCATVGVGGLALGGGYGFFSRKYGLTCDHILDFTLVTAAGKKLQASKNPELFWACKGGGNGNFGVLTRFKFRTHSAPKGFSSFRFKFRKLDAKAFVKIKDIWFQVAAGLPREAFSAFVLNGSTLTILFTSYTISVQNIEKEIAPLLALNTEYKKWPHQTLAKALRRYYGLQSPIYFKNASAGFIKSPTEVKENWPLLFNKVQEYKGIILQWNTMGGAIADFAENSAYAHREAHFLGELQAYWEQPRQEANLRKGFQEIQDILFNAGIRKQYRNYPDVEFRKANEMYFAEQLGRLQKLKNELDPNNLFDYEQGLA